MEHLDAEGNPKRASLPDTIAPDDELTVAVARDLIDNHSGGPRELGVDPVSGGTVEVRNGRFGPYVALVPPAEAGWRCWRYCWCFCGQEGSKKAAAPPRRARRWPSLFKTMSLARSLSLEDALKLLSLPREVAHMRETNAETGEVSECTVAANNGRFWPLPDQDGCRRSRRLAGLGRRDLHGRYRQGQRTVLAAQVRPRAWPW